MSFPVVNDADTKTGSTTSNSATVTITYCTNIVSGDLLYLPIINDGATNYSSGMPAGWSRTINGNTANFNGTPEVNLWWKIADGTETGTFNLTYAASEMYAWTMYRINNWHGTSPPELAGSSHDQTAGTNAPDPSNCTPSWGADDTLWIASCAYDTGTITVNSYPGSYTNTANVRGNATQGVGLGICRRTLNAASEDAGTFSLSSSIQVYAWTLAVRPAPSARIPRYGFVNYQDPAVLAKAWRQKGSILVPKLWTPRPEYSI